MTTPTGSTLFLPWLRRGLATGIMPTADGSGGTATAGRVQVGVSLNQGTIMSEISLGLLGPGEISAVDPRVFARTWPVADAADAEPNYLPLVELAEPDLPWRYTPAAPSGAERLQPWLCLVVLRLDEVDELTGADTRAGGPLAAVTTRPAALPDLATSWAWAHTQVAGVDRLAAGEAAALLDGEPRRLVARLLCSRRLEPDQDYLACVVPTFEAGRARGLGTTPAASLNPLAPAWTGTQGSVRLPIYHRWTFRTGPGGDFETLVTRLAGRAAPPTLGAVPLDVSDPGAGLPAAASAPLVAAGALLGPSAPADGWSPAERTRWTEAVSSLLNAAADAARHGDRVVVPPVYGSGPVAVDRVDAGAPRWLRELNTDPRARVVAGLGALVVSARQQELMAGAWAQVPGIREVSEELRFADLSRRTSARLHARHLANAPVDRVLAISASYHGRIPAPGARAGAATGTGNAGTVGDGLRASPLVDGAFGGAWRRLVRPRGRLVRRAGTPVFAAPTLVRMNDGRLRAAAPPAPPAGMATVARLAATSRAGTAAAVAAAPAGGRFVPVEPPPGAHVPAVPAGPAAGQPDGPQDPSAVAFRTAAAAAEALVRPARRPTTPARRLDLPALRAGVAAAVEPGRAIAAAARSRVRLDPAARRVGHELDRPLVTPRFDLPMAAELASLATGWLLPGGDAVPTDTVCALAPNRRFVEAFLAGLNHAMARELRWQGFPVDPRGTFFRRFWEAEADIAPMASWRADAALGENTPAGSGRPDRVVLLVRGEVIRRYPGTVVYAARARRDGQVLGVTEVERQPVFSGRLGPDTLYVGFDLTLAEAMGASGPAGDPGWWFMIAEPLAGPRFGLEPGEAGQAPATAWKDLSWGHLAATPDELAALTHLDLNATLPDTRQIADPTSRVWHAERGLGATGGSAATVAHALARQRVRIGVHASRLLPSPP